MAKLDIKQACVVPKTVAKGTNVVNKTLEKVVDMTTGIPKGIPVVGDFIIDQKMAFRRAKNDTRRRINAKRPCKP